MPSDVPYTSYSCWRQKLYACQVQSPRYHCRPLQPLIHLETHLGSTHNSAQSDRWTSPLHRLPQKGTPLYLSRAITRPRPNQCISQITPPLPTRSPTSSNCLLANWQEQSSLKLSENQIKSARSWTSYYKTNKEKKYNAASSVPSQINTKIWSK